MNSLSLSHVLVVFGMIVSTISMALSSFFYFSAIHERKMIETTAIMLTPREGEGNGRHLHNLVTDNNEEYDDRLRHHRRLETKYESYLITTGRAKVIKSSYDEDGITGTQLIFNSEGVYKKSEESLLGTELDDSYYTQRCIATKGLGGADRWPAFDIKENMCSFTFCLQDNGKKGCIFLHSAATFVFDPAAADKEIPDIYAAIIGGTGYSRSYHGGARIRTISRSSPENEQNAVLSIELFYKEQDGFPEPPKRGPCENDPFFIYDGDIKNSSSETERTCTGYVAIKTNKRCRKKQINNQKLSFYCPQQCNPNCQSSGRSSNANAAPIGREDTTEKQEDIIIA